MGWIIPGRRRYAFPALVALRLEGATIRDAEK
jgi:hypothetical protein